MKIIVKETNNEVKYSASTLKMDSKASTWFGSIVEEKGNYEKAKYLLKKLLFKGWTLVPPSFSALQYRKVKRGFRFQDQPSYFTIFIWRKKLYSLEGIKASIGVLGIAFDEMINASWKTCYKQAMEIEDDLPRTILATAMVRFVDTPSDILS